MNLSRSQFEKLAVEQIDMVYRMARRLARDPLIAEDLVQETYLRALRASDTFHLEAFGMRPWLFRILHNVYLSRRQRHARRPVALDSEHLEALEGPGGSDSLPLDPRSYESMDGRLVKAVEALPEEYRAVLLLWAVEDFAYKEIAEALEIPIGTVMSRLYRALARLAEQLKDYAIEEGIVGNRT